MTQITKDQHFVPKFYLKQFAREKKIQVFDVRARRIGKPRPYVSVCYEKGTVKLSGILGFWRRHRSSVERRINNLGTCRGAD